MIIDIFFLVDYHTRGKLAILLSQPLRFHRI